MSFTHPSILRRITTAGLGAAAAVGILCTPAQASSFSVELLTAPHAAAQDSPPDGQRIAGSNIRLSASGAKNAQTRAIAEANPAAVTATGLLCGSGYELASAERLPDARRFGTLFTYAKYVKSPGIDGSCAVFDNNTVGAKHMKLKLCYTTCTVDEGTFSQYAGPVKIESQEILPNCAMVTAVMWSNDVAIIDRVRHVDACD